MGEYRFFCKSTLENEKTMRKGKDWRMCVFFVCTKKEGGIYFFGKKKRWINSIFFLSDLFNIPLKFLRVIFYGILGLEELFYQKIQKK